MAQYEKRTVIPSPYWQDDDNVVRCADCHKSFGITLRRHHCRGCGIIFCDKCTSNKRVFPEIGCDKKERSCRFCLTCPLYLQHYQERSAYVRNEDGQRAGISEEQEEAREELYLRFRLDVVVSREEADREVITQQEEQAAATLHTASKLLIVEHEEEEERMYLHDTHNEVWMGVCKIRDDDMKELKKQQREKERLEKKLQKEREQQEAQLEQDRQTQVMRSAAASTLSTRSNKSSKSSKSMLSSFARPPAVATVSHEGVLLKHGAGLSGWAKRYFVLRGANLQYYTAKDGELKGTIDLLESKITPKGKEITITGPFTKRDFRLKTVDGASITRWVSSLKMAAHPIDPSDEFSDNDELSEYSEYSDHSIEMDESEYWSHTDGEEQHQHPQHHHQHHPHHQSQQCDDISVSPATPTKPNHRSNTTTSTSSTSSTTSSSSHSDTVNNNNTTSNGTGRRLSASSITLAHAALPDRPLKVAEMEEKKTITNLEKDNIEIDDEAAAIASLMADITPTKPTTSMSLVSDDGGGPLASMVNSSFSSRPSANSSALGNSFSVSSESAHFSTMNLQQNMSMNLNGSRCAHQGYLEKRKIPKGGGKGWAKFKYRYFELIGDEMHYYKNKKGQKKGQFKINNADIKCDKEDDRLFTIDQKDAEFIVILKSGSVENRRLWISALNTAQKQFPS